MTKSNGRLIALEALEEGLIDEGAFARACISWMTAEDVEEMMKANELWPGMFEDEDDEDE